MRNVIVFDVADQQFYRNQLFNPDVAVHYPGALSSCRFYEFATDAGYQVVTADLVDEMGIDPHNILIVTSDRMKWAEKLSERGGVLAALNCFETPSFTWRFYRDLDKISSRFQYVFLFPGAAPRVRAKNTKFHPTLFPQPYREILPDGRNRDWSDRKFAAMVYSNIVRRLIMIKPEHMLAVLTDPDLRCELYSERRRAIRYFHRHEGFHLFGGGWDRWRLGVSYGDYRAALHCYQGRCEYKNKIGLLSGYRFSICYDNAIFPGYVTEKIFDCFYAGCVPVYYGAPDVSEYIPKNCFIDKRDFSSYRDLDRYLSQVGPTEFDGYHQAINDFLQSEAFEPFYQDNFARSLLAAIDDCVLRMK
jgi:hypothetical protein